MQLSRCRSSQRVVEQGDAQLLAVERVGRIRGTVVDGQQGVWSVAAAAGHWWSTRIIIRLGRIRRSRCRPPARQISGRIHAT